MTIPRKTLADMNRDSLGYLANNTDVTYFAEGSIARALIEANNLEVSRLQDFIGTQYDNAFLSSASGIYLDLFGEMLGVPRILDTKAAVGADDAAVRFYVLSGTLASRLRDPADPNRGLIPAGTRIQNAEGSVVFTVPTPIGFPFNARSVFVPAVAQEDGEGFNVGINQLTAHDLGIADVLVTNDQAIATGADIETDEEYRFRLSRQMTARATSNETAIELAALTQPGVAGVQLIEFARGAGTFDVLLTPRGNRVTRATIDATRRAVEQAAAFGVSPRIREPEYLAFKITIQLRFRREANTGSQGLAKNRAQTAILDYFANIPMGGEIVINQIRASILSIDESIQDLRIVELCIDGRPRALRNILLREDELLIPDTKSADPVLIV